LIKLVDMKCKSCKKVFENVFEDEMEKCPECGGKLARMFGYRKYSDFIEGYYENFEHEPIYIKTRQQFKQECKKRNLYQKWGKGAYDI